MAQGRGQLTDRIKKRSVELLGYEIDQVELRLLPYILYTCVNSQWIDPAKVNGTERAILSKWRTAGHIEGGAGGLLITREFYDIASDIVFLGYVDLYEGDDE